VAVASRAKKKWRHRQNSHPALKRKLAAAGLWDGQQPIVSLPGDEKMSRIILDFAAPYTATAESEEELRIALQICMVAWNIALLPPDVREQNVESLIKDAVSAGADDFMACIDKMVERKQQYFADCRRWILAHELEMTRHGPRLSVVSTRPNTMITSM
jgi:hypothetical protein